MLHSNVVAADIVSHIANEMKDKLLKTVISDKLPFSVLTDKSTSLSQKSCMMVYLRCSISQSCEPVTVFLDLVELCGLTSHILVDALMTCLHVCALTEDVLSAYWLGLTTDAG